MRSAITRYSIITKVSCSATGCCGGLPCTNVGEGCEDKGERGLKAGEREGGGGWGWVWGLGERKNE